MNKKEIIETIFHETGMTKTEIDLVLTKFLETVMNAVSKGEKVQLVGFGSFSSFQKNLYLKSTGTNTVIVKKSSDFNIKFSPGKFFKEKVNVS